MYQIVTSCFTGWEKEVGNRADLTLSTLYILYFSVMFEFL